MELLYIWINRGRNIYQQGYNFSMKNRFIITCQEEIFKLREIKVSSNIESFFDEERNITNITAVVGKNGAGKTSLLQELFSLDCLPLFEEKNSNYIEYEKEEYEKNKRIMIFRKNQEIIIYHNLMPKEFYNETSYKVLELYKYSEDSKMIYDNSTDFKDITTIFLTNSWYNYEKKGIFTYKKLSQIVLSPNALETIASTYYKNLLHLEDNKFTCFNLFTYNNKVIIKQRKQNNFQQICDILYFEKLYARKLFDNYAGVIATKIQVSCCSCIYFIQKSYNKFLKTYSKQSGDKFEQNLFSKYQDFIKYLLLFDTYLLKDTVMILKFNLLFECIFEFDLSYELYSEIITGRNIMDFINEIIRSKEDSEIKKYFLTAIYEIKKFEKIKKIL